MEVNDQIIDHGLSGRGRVGLTSLLKGLIDVHLEALLIAEGHTGISMKGSDGKVSYHGLESSGVCMENCSISPHESCHPEGLVE